MIELERMARNVELLATQVKRLADRIEPFEGQVDAAVSLPWLSLRPRWTLDEAMKVLCLTRRVLEACEGAYLADDIRPWMKPRK
ncbi:MAG: hypothetical protein K2Q10_09465 [Rhodospirillales bacterium]|nr:hypothetical protein [Rhodospirillales bacterium]